MTNGPAAPVYDTLNFLVMLTANVSTRCYQALDRICIASASGSRSCLVLAPRVGAEQMHGSGPLFSLVVHFFSLLDVRMYVGSGGRRACLLRRSPILWAERERCDMLCGSFGLSKWSSDKNTGRRAAPCARGANGSAVDDDLNEVK